MSDKKLQIGQVIQTATLNMIVVDTSKNGAKCKCNICNNIDSYRVSDIINNKVQICKSCSNGYKEGDVVNNLQILRFVDTNTVAAECQKHGNKKLYVLDFFVNGKCRCKLCNIKGTSIKSENKIDTKKKETKIKKAKNKSSKLGLFDGFIEEVNTNMGKYPVRGDFIIVGKKIKRSPTGSSISEILKCQCMKCGSITQKSETELSKCNKCKKCAEISKDNRNIIENNNWVGYIRHGLKITKCLRDSNGVLMGDAHCIYCKSDIQLPIVTLVDEEELVCPVCGDTKAKWICPACGESHIKETPRKLYEDREEDLYKKCDNTNKKISIFELREKNEFEQRFFQIQKLCKGMQVKRRAKLHDGSNVFITADGYTGTDNKEYRSCFCEKHNKFLILAEDEIKDYEHELCAESRMIPFKKIK